MAVQTTADRLYDFLSQNVDDMPDRQAFDTAMQDKGSREKLHAFMQKNFDDVPKFEKFDRSLGDRNRTIPEKVVDTASAAADFISHPKGIKTRDIGQDVQTAGNAIKELPGRMGIKSVSDIPGFVGGAAMSGLYNASAGVVGTAQALSENLNPVSANPLMTLAMTPEARKQSLTGGGDAAIPNALANYQQSIQQSADASMPKDETGVASGIASTTQNLANLPLLLVGGPEAALGMMAAQTGGQSYSEARRAGVPPAQALVHGVSQGAIEYATEKIPVERLLGDLKTNAPLFQTVMHQLASEIPGEEIATLFQDLNDWATLHPDKPFSDYLAARPSAAAQTLVATVVGSVATGGVAKGVDAVAHKTVTMAERVHAKLEEKRAQQAQAPTPQAPANPQQTPAPTTDLNQAIIQQESSGRAGVVNPKSGATGAFQITRPFLSDANRFLGTSYTMEDMKDPQKAQQVKDAWHQHYTEQFVRNNGRTPTDREIAMMHHGGPKGYLRPNVADQEGVTNASYADQVTARQGRQVEQGEQPTIPAPPEQLISEDMQTNPVVAPPQDTTPIVSHEAPAGETQATANPSETAQEGITPPKATIEPTKQEAMPEPDKKELVTETTKKEPWQMSSQEWYDHKFSQLSKKAQKQIIGGDKSVATVEQIRGQTDLEHNRNIQKALSEGKPVPPEVLAEYPELKSQAALDQAKAEKVGSKTEQTTKKESWQMTRSEFIDYATGKVDDHGGWSKALPIEEQKAEFRKAQEVSHRQAVERAIGEGKPVPQEVIDEDPAFKKQAAFVEAKRRKLKKDEVRELDIEGRPKDGGTVSSGDLFRTATGRTTTPYPKGKHEKYSSQWLIENAIAEAESRGDDFNRNIFGGERVMKSGEIPTASRDSMLMYLFGKRRINRRLSQTS